jgi:hypothetical protein
MTIQTGAKTLCSWEKREVSFKDFMSESNREGENENMGKTFLCEARSACAPRADRICHQNRFSL